VLLYLKTEAEVASETPFFILDNGQILKEQEIVSVSHAPSSKPSSTEIYFLFDVQPLSVKF
jgi:hypothetical protein